MDKHEFVERLAVRTNLPKKDVRRFLDTFVELVQATLCQGEDVNLVGFGRFDVRARKASRRINPQTKQVVRVGSKVVPLFRPGRELKRQVARSLEPEAVAFVNMVASIPGYRFSTRAVSEVTRVLHQR